VKGIVMMSVNDVNEEMDDEERRDDDDEMDKE